MRRATCLAPAKRLESFDEEATGQREIDQEIHGSNIDGAHSSELTGDWKMNLME